MAIASIDTLRCVGRKKAPEPATEHFVRVLREWVEKNADGNQSEAARKLRGVTQGHISSVLGGKRGPGIDLLLVMRRATGRTVDDLLGFKVDPDTELVERFRETLELEVARERKQAREELEQARVLRAEATRILEEARSGREEPARKKKA